jgi:hypothetical protein
MSCDAFLCGFGECFFEALSLDGWAFSDFLNRSSSGFFLRQNPTPCPLPRRHGRYQVRVQGDGSAQQLDALFSRPTQSQGTLRFQDKNEILE